MTCGNRQKVVNFKNYRNDVATAKLWPKMENVEESDVTAKVTLLIAML